MRFTSFAPAMAGLIGASHALLPGLTGGLDLSPAVFDCAASWDNEVLFKGVAGVDSSTDAAINLGLNIREAQIEGLIDLKALDDFATEQVVRLDLEGLKAYIAVDISADAAVYETVELVASPHLEIDAGLLELALGAAFSLDLVIGVGAAIDLSAGVYVSFGAGDFIDVSLITKEIYSSKLDNLLAHALPIGVGASVDLSTAIEVQLGLRLRSHIVVEAGLDLLGLDILDAGLEAAIWVDLMTYAFALVETDNCAVSIKGEFMLNAGVCVDVGIQVLDILDLSLAPEVNVKLAGAINEKICLNGRGEVGEFLLPAVEDSDESAPTATGTVTASAPATTGSANATITNDGMVTSTISNTKTYTITSCHVSVPNCPASQTQVIVTSTVEQTVTVCPVESTEAPVPTSTSSTKKPVTTITETMTTVVPCEPTSSTLTPPTGKPPAPTVTITGTTSICPTETPSETPAPSSGLPSVSVPAPTSDEPKPTSEPESEPSTSGKPSVPVEEPTTMTPQPPVPTSVTPIPIPTWSVPVNSTWTSMTPPASTWVPPPSPPPTEPSTIPTPPPTAGAGAIKVGIAMAMPVVAALLL